MSASVTMPILDDWSNRVSPSSGGRTRAPKEVKPFAARVRSVLLSLQNTIYPLPHNVARRYYIYDQKQVFIVEIHTHDLGRRKDIYTSKYIYILIIKYAKVVVKVVVTFWIFQNILVKRTPAKSRDSRAPLGLRRPRGAATSHPHSSTTTC